MAKPGIQARQAGSSSQGTALSPAFLPGGPTPAPTPGSRPSALAGPAGRGGVSHAGPWALPPRLTPSRSLARRPCCRQVAGQPRASPRPGPGPAWLRRAAALPRAASAPCGAASETGWGASPGGEGTFRPLPPPRQSTGTLPPSLRSQSRGGEGAADCPGDTGLPGQQAPGWSGAGLALPLSTTAVGCDGHFYYY